MRFDVSSPREMTVASEIHMQFVSILESRREGTARLPIFSPPTPAQVYAPVKGRTRECKTFPYSSPR